MKKMLMTLLCLTIGVSSAFAKQETLSDLKGTNIFKFNLRKPKASDLGKRSSLWATYYHLPMVFAQTSGYALRNLKGNSLGINLRLLDWCNAAMEGSVRVKNLRGVSRTYNYAGVSSASPVSCKRYWSHNTSRTKFRIANGLFGDGVRSYKLVPFRTIAVDRRYFPYGSVFYIPSAVGTKIKLPNGKTVSHDGYFFAGDTGGAIKTNHIDVFIGPTNTPAKSNPFRWIRSNPNKTFKAHRVTNRNIINYLTDIHLN